MASKKKEVVLDIAPTPMGSKKSWDELGDEVQMVLYRIAQDSGHPVAQRIEAAKLFLNSLLDIKNGF